MKDKEVVEEKEEEEGISKFFDILTHITSGQTNTVQFLNREHPPSAPCPLGAVGHGSIMFIIF